MCGLAECIPLYPAVDGYNIINVINESNDIQPFNDLITGDNGTDGQPTHLQLYIFINYIYRNIIYSN